MSVEMSRLKLISYKGCHMCKQRFGCKMVPEIPVNVTFLKDQYIFEKGKNIFVFGKGETVVGKAKLVNQEIYCIKAYSIKQPDRDDIYISLKHIKVVVPKLGVVSHSPGIKM